LRKLQSEIRDLKDEQKSKCELFERKTRALETEKAEFSAKEQSLRENLAQVNKEREQLELESSERIETMKKDFNRHIEEYK
jgi:predicted  nucleic acid-binding Zn-ribbon protein